MTEGFGTYGFGGQRRFDEMVAALREYYEDMATPDRRKFRAWLERLCRATPDDLPWEASLRVNLHLDQYDDEGRPVAWNDVELSPWTMLAAAEAWDAGGDFVPASVLP